jgi:hypothetical protein
MMPILHHGCSKAGKALGKAAQFGSTFQVNMQIVLSQITGLIQIIPKQGQSRITMKVKNRKIH